MKSTSESFSESPTTFITSLSGIPIITSPGDLVIYIFLIIFFSVLIFKIGSFKDVKGAKAEIWVDGELKYVYPIQEEEKNIFVETNLGGCNVQFKDNMVRVTTSNSPLKIAVKQGFIK